MQRDTFFLLIAVIGSIPLGLLTNALFARWYKPTAMVHIGDPRGWRRAAGFMTKCLARLRGVGPVPEVSVVTDGSFIDTAVFFLSVIEGASTITEANIRLKHEHWTTIPYTVERCQNSIAYFNRGQIGDITVPVDIFCNLCSFRGYALIGRPSDFPIPPPDLRTAIEAVERLLVSRHRLKVISMGADAVRVLKTPLTKLFDSGQVLFESHPAEHALERFLKGKGDLFIAGLPQRLECERNGMIEVMSSQNNPLMFGINSMLYRGPGIKLEVLLQISVAWSRLCRKLSADEAYCRGMYAKWREYSSSLGIKELCFTEDDFVKVIHHQAGKFIRLFSSRDDAAQELIAATELCFNQADNLPGRDIQLKDLLRSLHESYISI